MAKEVTVNKEYQDLLPPLSQTEFDALKADIRNSGGVSIPVVVDEDGVVLDGHNRIKIDPDAPRRVVRGLSPAEKEAFIFRCNFMRRNLSPDQKREVLQRMRETAFKLREEDAKKWTQKRVAEALGVARNTVSVWLSGDISNVKDDNAYNSKPDARVKLSPEAKEEIVRRVKAGETQAQVAANYGVSQPAITNLIARDKKKTEAESEREKRVRKFKDLEIDGFIHGDFREVAKTIPDNSIDLIFTDPPYNRKTLPLYGDLAEMAAQKLVTGGSLICYLGQYQMDKVMELMTPHLRLWWTLAVVHGGTTARMREYGVVVKWKPLLWFVKKSRSDKETFVDDIVFSTQEKTDHPWQQSLVEAKYYIEKLVPKKGIVFDPFCGGGTTACACKELGRRCVTCDTDRKALAMAKGRGLQP